MNKYYKVVNSSLQSLCTFAESFRVQYKIGEFVTPMVRGSLLFVFDKKEDALNFAGPGNRVFEISIQNPTPISFLSLSTFERDFHLFWNSSEPFENRPNSCPVWRFLGQSCRIIIGATAVRLDKEIAL